MKRLSELAVGERGRVVRIEGQGALAERLAAMGVTVGAVVQCAFRRCLRDRPSLPRRPPHRGGRQGSGYELRQIEKGGHGC